MVIGLPASLGKAKGKCKIIMSADLEGFSKVEDGDVLVSDATTPDMTPWRSYFSRRHSLQRAWNTLRSWYQKRNNFAKRRYGS